MKKPDYFLASVLHVRRAGTIVAIPNGLMSSETDLSDEEIEQFKALGVLRKPTQDEWEAFEARRDGDAPAIEAEPIPDLGPGLPGIRVHRPRVERSGS